MPYVIQYNLYLYYHKLDFCQIYVKYSLLSRTKYLKEWTIHYLLLDLITRSNLVRLQPPTYIFSYNEEVA